MPSHRPVSPLPPDPAREEDVMRPNRPAPAAEQPVMPADRSASPLPPDPAGEEDILRGHKPHQVPRGID